MFGYVLGEDRLKFNCIKTETAYSNAAFLFIDRLYVYCNVCDEYLNDKRAISSEHFNMAISNQEWDHVMSPEHKQQLELKRLAGT